MKKTKRTIKIFFLIMFTLTLFTGKQTYAKSSYEIDVYIPIKLEIEEVLSDQEFKFKIEREDGQRDLLPEKNIISIAEEKHGQFGPIKFNRPGEYKYLIKQISGNNKNILYDRVVYSLTIYIENEKDSKGNPSGKLISSMTLTSREYNSKEDEIIFKNTNLKKDSTGKDDIGKKPPNNDSTYNNLGENPTMGDIRKLSLYLSLIIFSFISLYFLSKSQGIKKINE